MQKKQNNHTAKHQHRKLYRLINHNIKPEIVQQILQIQPTKQQNTLDWNPLAGADPLNLHTFLSYISYILRGYLTGSLGVLLQWLNDM